MDLKRRNYIADQFLLIMKQKLDEEPRTPYFDFKFKGSDEYAGRSVSQNPEGKFLTQLKELTGVTDEEFKIVLNYCYSQKYILGAQQYIRITYKGMERGNQVENELINQKQNLPEEKITYKDIKNNISKFEIQEKKILEKFLGMDSGYVLNFSNRTFSDFFIENFKINIYDNKYADRGESKAKRLRTFWEKESNSLVADSIEKMIEWWESDSLINEEEITNNQKVLAEKCKKIANNVRNRNTANIQNEEIEFLNKKFDSVNIKTLNLTTTMENVIQQRLDEIKKCLNGNIALGAIFLIGSTLEGLLIDVAKRNPEKFNKSKSAPKDTDGNIKNFKDWSLNSLIDVAQETNFIGLDVKKFSHNLRDFRNYIHPEEQVTQNFNPDKNTALIAYNVLLAAMEDLNKQNNKY